MPEWLVLTFAMLAACAVVIAVTLVRHRTAAEDEDPSETPDVIEYMTMWIGVVYAIVLGLAIAGVWEARGVAEDHVQTEAQALHEISERVRVYPPDVRDRIRADVNAYVGHVVTVEWQAMADKGEVTERGDELLMRLREDVTDYEIRRTTRELVLAGLFSALIAFLLFLIWDFDAPYSRGVTASAEPFLHHFPGVSQK
ncbi:bestrophin-like domain [Streptomyces antibioticus]|uniref:DUF4239 domain-containing protein n=1 Tax=Streptomyces antibioticus TaxID=1890 RepID=A0AAE7CNK8_STRAT|nr:DUF4239 domain-containing protein [Streptomyces antibioticus]QIT47871.1 DUF4239 domain-containing protein [Streptomyces antibioticus]